MCDKVDKINTLKRKIVEKRLLHILNPDETDSLQSEILETYEKIR